jgi:phosphate/sulfate permease
MSDVAVIIIVTIGVALIFDIINGFHDAANSIATVVSTRVLSPRAAVWWAALANFIALFIFHQGVADTIAKTIDIEFVIVNGKSVPHPAYVWIVFAGLAGAIAWNLFTWWIGLPSSSSHALIGGLSGAGLAFGDSMRSTRRSTRRSVHPDRAHDRLCSAGDDDPVSGFRRSDRAGRQHFASDADVGRVFDRPRRQ